MKTVTKQFLFAITLLVAVAGAGVPASAQTAVGGAISGTIRWQKIYGHPNAKNPFDGLVIAASGPNGRTYSRGRHLSFSETEGYYECAYNISGLPEGVSIRVSVGLASGYKWVGFPPLLVGRYRTEFVPAGWSGEVVLMRPNADTPARARGDFAIELVAKRQSGSIPFPRRNP